MSFTMYRIAAVILLCAGACLTQSDTCSTPGYYCSTDCKSIMYCSGGTPLLVSECSGEEICQKAGAEVRCSVNNTCVDPNKPFLCFETGIFPDPYDCSKGYYCLAADGKEAGMICNCPTGSSFNPPGLECLDGTECPRTPAVCKSLGDHGNLDDKFCYFCNKELYPIVTSCAGRTADQEFVQSVLDNAVCATPSSTGLPASSSSTETGFFN